MGTKNNPGKFDCYESALPDEPMFVLLARDPHASLLVDLWADLRELHAGNPSKVAEARECALTMREYFAETLRIAGRQMGDDAYNAARSASGSENSPDE